MTRERFRVLTDQWRDDTRFASSDSVITAHPAYREIIAEGPRVIPWILDEMKRSPSHWFAALIELTGENPIPEEDRGVVRKMTRLWIEWGEAKGLI